MVVLAGAIGVGVRYASTYNSTGSKKVIIVAAINIIGSFLIGYLVTAMKGTTHESVMTAISIGLLGGLTTFSSFSLDTVSALQESRFLFASSLMLATVFGSLLFCYAGIVIARTTV